MSLNVCRLEAFSGDTPGGGAILNLRGHLSIEYTLIYDNSAPKGYGGAIYSNGGSVTIEGSQLYGNTARFGGALALVSPDPGSLLRSSTVHENETDYEGLGGGLYLYGGEFTIENSTFSGNQATNGPSTGGNIYVGLSGTLYLANATIAFGSATNANSIAIDSFANYVLSFNTIFHSNGSPTCFHGGVVLIDGIRNLSSDNSCQFNSTNNLSNIAPGLLSLAYNGGLTPTHEPTNRPPLDGGDNARCLLVDQRNMPRPVNLVCDIGAFEAQ